MPGGDSMPLGQRVRIKLEQSSGDMATYHAPMSAHPHAQGFALTCWISPWLRPKTNNTSSNRLAYQSCTETGDRP